jgi:hypothetical protein
LESLKFCSSFLICDVWRFRGERDFIALNMVVLFLISFSEGALLRHHLRWHRKLFFRLKHGGRQCWGVRKIGCSPRTQKFKTQIMHVTKVAKGKLGISESMHSPQKLWFPLHVPSHPLL